MGLADLIGELARGLDERQRAAMALAAQLQHHRRLQRQRASEPARLAQLAGHQQVLRLQGRAEDDVHVGERRGRGPDDVDAGEGLRRRRARRREAAQAAQALEHPQPCAAHRQRQQRSARAARQASPTRVMQWASTARPSSRCPLMQY